MKKNKKGEKELPIPSIGDRALQATKVVVAGIPLVGGSGVEIMNMVITPPLERRRNEWFSDLAQRLFELEDRVEGFRVEELSENSAFITTALQASTIALRNHQTEKLEALKNAVLNAALPKSPDENLQQMFLSFVDAMTEWHIRILLFFNDPIAWGKAHGVGFTEPSIGCAIEQRLVEAFPDLKGKSEMYTQIVKELATNMGLIADVSLQTMMTGPGTLSSRTTGLGKKFVTFITEQEIA
jgi:hypothetical protein